MVYSVKTNLYNIDPLTENNVHVLQCTCIERFEIDPNPLATNVIDNDQQTWRLKVITPLDLSVGKCKIINVKNYKVV